MTLFQSCMQNKSNKQKKYIKLLIIALKLPKVIMNSFDSLAQEVWRGATVVCLSVTSEEAFWSSLSGGLFQAEGRLEANFCHTVGNLDPQERGHHREVLSILAPRRRMPLEPCTSATIDFVLVIGKLCYWSNGSAQPCYPILSNRVTARKLAVITASFLAVTYVSQACINTYTLK